jgi:glyoxylase-like metal-dependent hydrolase (beta-lactamase superfamily II)
MYAICATCGTQFAGTDREPEHCPICEDERQYIGPNGQQWTTLTAIQATHHNTLIPLEPGLHSILTEPRFPIGQRAHLIQSPGGNVLWDCIALIDDATVEAVRALGGISAIAISHPHYYTTMVEWAHTFGAPVYLHAADREWVMRPEASVSFWEGDTHPLWDGMMLIRGGGHYAGGTMLHWPTGVDGRGVLFTGDIIQVVADQRWVTFMWSYPNSIPLNATQVRGVVASVEPFAFDRIYGAFGGIVSPDAKGAVHRSADRYIEHITG